MSIENAIQVAKLAAVVAALTAGLQIALLATEKFRYANQYAGYAATVTLGTTAAVTASYVVSRPWWILIWLVCAAAAMWTGIGHLTRTYPRRQTTNLIRERLRTILGADWNGHVTMTFAADNTAETIDVTLPAKIIPSDITPRMRTVLSETLSGTWTISTKGTSVSASRKVVEPDPPAVKNLKDILLSAKAFTSRAKIPPKLLTLDPDSGTVTGFTVHYDSDTATDLVLGQRRRRIEDLIRQRLDAGVGAWVFTWNSVERTCQVRRSVFKSKILHVPNPSQRFTTRPEVVDNYPQMRLPLGVDEFGTRVEWQLVGKGTPHGVITGSTGAGKSSQLHTILTGAAGAGMCIIIADFKMGEEYDGFRDWPNVHLVAQDTYSCLRTICYVEELMHQRKTGGKGPRNAPAAGVPILFILDEYAVFSEKLRNEIWPEFRNNTEDKLPPTPPSITSMGALYREGRSFGVHTLSALQRATANYFDAEFKHNAPLKIQVGHIDGTSSQNFWDDFDIGQSVPEQTPGRALIKGPEGFVPYQGFYTPDPAKALTTEEQACLQALMPQSRLYNRALFDMPDANDIESWDQIATAPLISAAERPDLDPLSEMYNTRRTLRRDTISGVIDAASMQFRAGTKPHPVNLDAR
ncbi:FtsK/SpoIIIE family protein (plasmid) [Mycobacterium sp. THAF192]|nr:FtsK/SpoIIIE family protein [Mycobacterium sp. THAF192]